MISISFAFRCNVHCLCVAVDCGRACGGGHQSTGILSQNGNFEGIKALLLLCH